MYVMRETNVEKDIFLLWFDLMLYYLQRLALPQIGPPIRKFANFGLPFLFVDLRI